MSHSASSRPPGDRANPRRGNTVCRLLCAAIVLITGASVGGQQSRGRPRPTPRAPARLVVDGESVGDVAADQVKRVPVSLGHQASRRDDDASVRVQQTVEVKTARQMVVTAPFEAGLRRVRAARAQTEAAESAEAAFRSRFQVNTETVIDRTTKLEWAGRDNGSDIKWNNTTKYCADLRIGGASDWRLPSVEELEALYHAVESRPLEPLSYGGSWHPVPGVRASYNWFWSGTRIGASEAWGVFFYDGWRAAYPVDVAPNVRALCVRRASG